MFHYREPRVPHISPDFGEMWESTDAGARVPVVPEDFRSERSQFPHLAKGWRDMGHPHSWSSD
jgi:hypothetical protein